MNYLNKNKLVNRKKAFALKVATVTFLFLVAFAIEQYVGYLFADVDFAFAEFAVSELGSGLAAKVLVRVFLLFSTFASKGKKNKF